MRTGTLKKMATGVWVAALATAFGVAGCSKPVSEQSEKAYLERLRQARGMTAPDASKPGEQPAGHAGAQTPLEDAAAVVAQYVPDLASNDPMKRMLARSELRRTGQAAASALVRFARETASAEGRGLAVELLAEQADESVAADLEALYTEKGASLGPDERSRLIQTWHRVAGAKCVARLRADIADERDPKVKQTMAVALASQGDATGVEVFLGVLERGIPEQKKWASHWLGELCKQDFGDNVKAWRDWIAKNPPVVAPK
jgi:hypothetical protein